MVRMNLLHLVLRQMLLMNPLYQDGNQMVEIGIIMKIIVQLLIGKTLTELGTTLMEVV